jgi:hypothetical protein
MIARINIKEPVKPLPEDPIEASKGMLKGKTSILRTLLKDRKREARHGMSIVSVLKSYE